MKRALLTMLVFLLMPLSCAFAADGSAVDGTAVAAFQTSTSWNKLDDALKGAWIDAMKASDGDRILQCFVRVRDPATRGDEAFLNSHGFAVRVFAGTIARGSVKAADLPGVAELPFVSSIKLSTP